MLGPRAGLLLVFICAAAHAEGGREVLSLNHGWRFVQANPDGAQAEHFDDRGWTPLDVPHTWNRLGNFGTERVPESNSTQGLGWYRLHFEAPDGPARAHYFLQFDGVGEIADVWLNGVALGHHAGAFARFRLDATALIHRHGDNVLALRADNTRPQPGASTQDVIPLSGDFFIFGGIYRDVSLLVTDPVHVDLLDYGGPGLYVRTESLAAHSAQVRLRARVVDEAQRGEAVQAEFEIADAQGRVVAASSRRIRPGRDVEEIIAPLTIAEPRRWRGLSDPYQYAATVTLRSRQGRLLDRVVQDFGLRTFRFDADRGFFLNGEHLPLHGVSRHQDRPRQGWAIARPDIDQDFDLMQDMGVNAVRFAHYQHGQYAYEVADRRGMVVWAEIPLVNKVSFDGSAASAGLVANARQQLLELIHQNFNHPSIAVWSLANEVDLTALLTKGESHAASLVSDLNELAHREDPSRATTFADCCEMGLGGQPPAGEAARDPLFGITDTIGYNRYFGWYTGAAQDLGPMLDAAHARHPGLPMAVSEYGAGAALTQHSDDARGGPINSHGRPHPEEYQSLLHEQSWPAIAARDYLWGSFIWNMFDFSSDSRREGDLTDINEKGMVSYDRSTRKDAYYYYRANWNPAPTLHLASARYRERDYASIEVKAYSNADSARLTVNGGEPLSAPCVAHVCRWSAVRLEPGDNMVVASAAVRGEALRDAVLWHLAHAAGEVRIKAGSVSGMSTSVGRFGSDAYFEGGRAGSVGAADGSGGKSVAAAEPSLFASYREGQFAYRIPVPNGRYRVTLYFVEPMAQIGERVFDVSANGIPAIENLDVNEAAGGMLRGTSRQFDTRVTSANLTLDFHARTGEALVCALAVTPLDSH
jgi:beta-galactosidase